MKGERTATPGFEELVLRALEMLLSESLSGGFQRHRWDRWLDDFEAYKRARAGASDGPMTDAS
jgi:hypothetical protein